MSGTLNAPLQPALEKRDEAGTGTSWRAGVMSQAAGTSHLDPSWKLPQGEELRCSKVLAWILRHGGVRAGYKMTADGFVRVDEILSKARELHQDRTLTEGNVRWMVAHNDKQRFRLKEHEGNLWVAASQGHSESLGLGNAHLTPVTDARKHPSVCHGTYYDVVDKILAEGLRPMSRQHVHFCDGDPGDGARIRGLRKSAEILVFVDVGKCIADGMEFFVAANGVLLSPGNADRRIPAKYFRAVLEASSRSAYNPDARW